MIVVVVAPSTDPQDLNNRLVAGVQQALSAHSAFQEALCTMASQQRSMVEKRDGSCRRKKAPRCEVSPALKNASLRGSDSIDARREGSTSTPQKTLNIEGPLGMARPMISRRILGKGAQRLQGHL